MANDRGNGGPTVDRVTFETVLKDEAAEIVQRRERAGLNPVDVDTVRENLVGLAFSGGGIRSGAVGLGILQGLDQTDKLKYVDFLSTVSGGGYAGAYLSSFAAQQAAGGAPGGKADATDPARPEEEKAVGRLPITPYPSGKQRSRILEFLGTSRRFARPLVFSNRYLIGLLLNWVVIFSGLVAVASAAAWLFRQIYDPVFLDYLYVLGFQDDFGVCLFVPLVILLLWAAAWIFSYLSTWASSPANSSSRATGFVARILFVGLIVSAAMAFAALLGSGDIDAKSWYPLTSASSESVKNESVNRLFGTVQTIVLTAIVAALLPYLSPMRFFRSGAPTARPTEKYIYAVASRALVFGVPFLAVFYFLQEDISGWYSTRDGSVHRGEIRNWMVFDPKYEKSVDGARLWQGNYATSELSLRRLAHLAKEWLERKTGWTIAWNPSVYSADAAFAEFRKWQKTSDQYDHLRPKGSTAEEQRNVGNIHFWTRLGYFLIDSVGDEIEDSPKPKKSWFDNFVSKRNDLRKEQEEIARQITLRLADPGFATEFLPERALEGIKTPVSHLKFADDKDRDAWVLKLRQARGSAIATGKYESSGTSPTKDTYQFVARERAIVDANRKLLNVYYGDALEPTTTVFSSTVWEHDQKTRLWYFKWSLLCFVLSAMVVSLNATSCHGYYAAQTAQAWIEPVPGPDRDLPLAQLNSTAAGWPYHLMSGCVRYVGRRRDATAVRLRGGFLFSNRYVGSPQLGYRPTAQFMDGKYALPDAIAASGGAVSPTQSGNPLNALLLILMNLRLGQWVENPGYKTTRPQLSRLLRKWPFTPARWLWSWAYFAEDRAYCLVSDGGYYENLGVEELLRRRCKLVIAVDAGQDEKHQFEDFVRLVRRARMEYGIQIKPLTEGSEWDLLKDVSLPDEDSASGSSKVKPESGKKKKSAEFEVGSLPKAWTKEHFVAARIVYPNGQNGLLVYVKSSLTGKEPLELVQFQKSNPAFPHDPTSDQLYSPDQFLSYVQLGQFMATELASRLPKDLDRLSIDAIVRHFTKPKAAKADEDVRVDRDADAAEFWLDGIIQEALQTADPQEAAKRIGDAVAKMAKRPTRRIVAEIRQTLEKLREEQLDRQVRGVRQTIIDACSRP